MHLALWHYVTLCIFVPFLLCVHVNLLWKNVWEIKSQVSDRSSDPGLGLLLQCFLRLCWQFSWLILQQNLLKDSTRFSATLATLFKPSYMVQMFLKAGKFGLEYSTSKMRPVKSFPNLTMSYHKKQASNFKTQTELIWTTSIYKINFRSFSQIIRTRLSQTPL